MMFQFKQQQQHSFRLNSDHPFYRHLAVLEYSIMKIIVSCIPSDLVTSAVTYIVTSVNNVLNDS